MAQHARYSVTEDSEVPSGGRVDQRTTSDGTTRLSGTLVRRASRVTKVRLAWTAIFLKVAGDVGGYNVFVVWSDQLLARPLVVWLYVWPQCLDSYSGLVLATYMPVVASSAVIFWKTTIPSSARLSSGRRGLCQLPATGLGEVDDVQFLGWLLSARRF